MKKIAILLMFITASLYGQTWIRSYQWDDLCPGPYTSGSAEVWNVIPAIGGGYLLQGHVEFSYGDIPAYEGNAFWLIDEFGDVILRTTRGSISGVNSIVSNGVDRYYCLDSYQGRSFLDIYDADMNFLNHYWFAQVNGYDLQLNDMQFVDDGLVFAGQRNGQGVILKTDFAFNVVWQNSSIYLSNTDGFHSIRRTSANGFLSMARDVIAKYDATGDTLWTARIPPVWQRFFCVIEHSNGGIYALKRSYTDSIWRLDSYESNGSLVESINVGVPTLLQFGTTSMQETTDGNLVIYIAGDHVLNKLSLSGDTIWSSIFPAIMTTGFGSKNFCISESGFITFCGGGYLGQITLIRAASNGQTQNIDEYLDVQPGITLFHHPNPASTSLTIAYTTKIDLIDPKIEMFNLRGQRVKSINIPHDSKELKLSAVDLGTPSSGIYFYQLVSKYNSSKPHKLIIVK